MDIDIDITGNFDTKLVFPGSVRASIYKDRKLTPHPCGVYFQQIPEDPVSKLAAIEYKTAEELGCFKIDFLHLTVYDYFSSREEIQELLEHEPDWDLLQHPSVVSQLFQLSKHLSLLQQCKPRSIEEVADVLALIRPQKRFMLQAYLRDPSKIRESLYKIDGEGYAFKKAHAISYSLVVVLQLHLIKGGLKLS